MKINHIEKNKFSRSGEKLIEVKAIIIHYTACPKATAQNIRDYFNNLKNQTDIKSRSASAHYAIDDTSTIEIIPPDEVAYHVGASKSSYTDIAKSFGDRSPNNYTLGIELCHDDDTGRFSPYVMGGCMELVRDLLKENNLTTENVFRHFDITGKNCPRYFVENKREWEVFLNLL